ncbi:UDP-N-acetylmuramate dehydrogenase [Halorhodospira halophila]|uniref:UDP-N-acetylenolpyruvoylglucosamine reductase n=1 Tax=Halorhodospira halophila (strain DSM 244 / SL1) TaxID=349124 RepID=A1WYU1_HALHL|nr:UDP-N-acetylmuramate dehydrogenase [Halorhodospira halophila]ABM62853.1 UDP-N-acetylmuramate dehydrogenase [Halorhodospira halophila SL1]MBK1728024.1 UDP-N-acetylenolpyruvoylglucosamine reductase [Halorhodospira halophila]
MSAAAERRRIRPGEWREQEPMAGYTTWRVGGPARRLFCPADRAGLLDCLARLSAEEPLHWCGLGSNLLVRDGGVAGTVILSQGGLDGLAVDGAQGRVHAEAGVAGGRLARAAVREGLAGLEFLAGIPGTVGGALALNAGAWGGETWSRVVEVETVDRHGCVRRRTPADFRVGYRRVVGPAGEWFLAATWALPSGDPQALNERVRALLRRRNAAQPVGQPTCGSVFRNPPGDAAGRLIEQAGLKGARRGGARVSERHANFIINEGGSAADIEGLIEVVRQRVAEVHGVRLETEVHVIGGEQS